MGRVDPPQFQGVQACMHQNCSNTVLAVPVCMHCTGASVPASAMTPTLSGPAISFYSLHLMRRRLGGRIQVSDNLTCDLPNDWITSSIVSVETCALHQPRCYTSSPWDASSPHSLVEVRGTSAILLTLSNSTVSCRGTGARLGAACAVWMRASGVAISGDVTSRTTALFGLWAITFKESISDRGVTSSTSHSASYDAW